MKIGEVKDRIEKGMYVEKFAVPLFFGRREYFNNLLDEQYLFISKNVSPAMHGYCSKCDYLSSTEYRISAVTSDLRKRGELVEVGSKKVKRYPTGFSFCKKCGFVGDYKKFREHWWV